MYLVVVFALIAALFNPAAAVQETQTDRGDPRDGNRQSEQDHGGLSRFGRSLYSAFWNGWDLFLDQCCGGDYTDDGGPSYNEREQQREGDGSPNF